MKVATSAYQTSLFSNDEPVLVDLLVWTFADGTILRLSLRDLDVNYSGHTYTSAGPYVMRGTRKQTRGIDPDTLELTIFAAPTQLVDLGLPLLRTVVAGLANGAIVELRRGVNPTLNPDGTLTVTEAVLVFKGLITETKTGRTSTEITVSDFRWLLKTPWPRDVVQPSCRWTWGVQDPSNPDANCAINPVSYEVAGIVQSGPNSRIKVMMPSLIIPGGVPLGGQTAPSGYFDLGRIQFITGNNTGQQRQVQTFLGAGNAASYEQAVLNDSPIGFYYLDESSGTTAIDHSGKNRNGTYHGGITLGQAGALVGDAKTGIKFDGSTGFMTLPIPKPAVAGGKGFAVSFEFFMKLNIGSSNQPQGILDTAPKQQDTLWNVAVEQHGLIATPRFAWRFTPLIEISETSGVWRHIIIVFRGHRTIDYYENGQLVATASASNVNNFNWTNPIVVGRVWVSGPINRPTPFVAHWYDAYLQMFSIYDYPISPDQAASHYAASQNAPGVHTGQVILTHPLPYVPQAGEEFVIFPGCDKTLRTCINRFNNAIHFGGFPFVPIPETVV